MVESPEFLPSKLLNPFTPMAFLSPELAYEKAITTYISIGMLGVLSWDILVHLGADYELLKRHRVGVPTLAYHLSRSSESLPSEI
ncbi:hypothetical protein BDZ94DRAFT_1316123 [Collybia nuda]|uniref:Uncharacterized protein n=1 Tax=Collybia nuda TaxID=64659 RepID=A0A9P5XS44_9AGAR|nr:hypothetical protein BDZ94DRAFT_1316123 [Collybia nuda]